MKKVSLLIIVTIIVIVLLSTGIYAWFSGGGMSSDNFIQYSGDVNLNVGLFHGVDYNRDGKLDACLDDDNNPVYAKTEVDPITGLTKTKSPRNKITKHMYNEIDRLEGAIYEEYISGTSIILKLVVENPKTADTDAQIAICFSNLSEYFFQSQNLNEEEMQQVLKSYTARIMFKLDGITARAYKNSGTGGNFVSGYNTLSASSVVSEQNPNVRPISTLNTLGKSSFYLWEISESQKFVENIKIKKGEVLEIDFVLTCLQTEEIFINYAAYWQNYITANPMLTVEQKDFINYMSRKELAYLVSDENENIELNFTIEKLYVYGEQTPNE